MKLEEKNLIVKRSYKEVYKCEEGIVKIFAKEQILPVLKKQDWISRV